MLTAKVRKLRRPFYGWWVVAACFGILGIGSSLSLPSLSVIFLPITQELGFSRARLSLVFSLSSAEGALESPFIGWLIDRLGPRLLMVIGAIMAGVGYILLSRVHSFWAFLFIYLGLVSIGLNVGQWSPMLVAVNTWFRRRRALAMSIASSSTGVGSFIVPLFAGVVLAYGWRTGLVLVGLVMLLVLMPLSLLVRRSPESMGLRPDGDSAEQEAKAVEQGRAPEVDFTMKEALRSVPFWLTTIAMGMRFLGRGLMTLHFIPILIWKGLDPQYAAYLLGLMLFWALPARPVIGWLGDRFSKAKLLAIGMGLWTLSPLLLLYGEATWILWIGVSLFGLAEGFPPIHAALFGDYFGRKNYGLLRGLQQSLQSPGMIVAPFLAGLLYDRTQSYELVLLLTAGAFAVGMIVYALVWPPRRPIRVSSLA